MANEGQPLDRIEYTLDAMVMALMMPGETVQSTLHRLSMQQRVDEPGRYTRRRRVASCHTSADRCIVTPGWDLLSGNTFATFIPCGHRAYGRTDG